MAATAPNQRASLLSGLRTGGVRSTSVNVPHTAAPGATFNVPRFASASYNNNNIYDDEEDELAEMVNQKMYFNNQPPRMQAPPLTAAVDGSHNRFSQQQMRGGQYMHGGMNAMQAQVQAQQQQQQALQMQMMQLEMLRLQALQAQQYQAELIQAQMQQQQQQQQARSYNPPATAGPIATSFGSSQLRRPSQADSLRHQLGLAHEEQVPQTAALNGKFGGRLHIDSDFPGSRNNGYNGQQASTPMTPTSYASTNVISGGTSLGHASAAAATNNSTPPSKSDSASNWRRASTNNSVLRRSPPPAMPDVKVTPPPIDTDAPRPSGPQSALSPSSATPTARSRPTPLRFTPAVPLAATVAVSSDEGADSEDAASDASSNKSGGSPLDGSSPATPQSSGSFAPPLSPREAATQKLYEGLGLGRPEKVPQTPATAAAARIVSSVLVRQPRGPPSGADELGPRNFAQRIRKNAIGGLGALLESRSRSTTPTPVEVY
ncbi:hypothetical protein PENSPDRAFT_673853 [Peniophora sp. CONT]|nr:hypothetical protein PENSPDRAFT_673853 [Peniophora sp. CONT]